ncbi:MAG: nucleotide exchange factor GrpE [Candidatus Rokubacteria bacterium GWC2_70_16]|nr:MAG: nucleotide exchange factor GrpE [Candidatus Rokubacteria bacterium GWC2_70_16]OGL15901.1 MAG: nucleotide exchange factor GrpE [Candidatus Rokubacteria bacterium RIFCSPLOWO2_12_FULL_71_19]
MSEHETDPDSKLVPPDLPAEAASDPGSELRQLREALGAKTREAEAHWERYVRTVAEYDNARKRAARDREEYIRTANEALLRELLPALDNFDRALQAARGDAGAAAVTAGVELIQRELLRVLEKVGVTPFASLGAAFDPERHEAIARVPASGEPEMTVVGETARGYLLHGRVLRPAMVTVAMTPEPDAPAGDAS